MLRRRFILDLYMEIYIVLFNKIFRLIQPLLSDLIYCKGPKYTKNFCKFRHRRFTPKKLSQCDECMDFLTLKHHYSLKIKIIGKPHTASHKSLPIGTNGKPLAAIGKFSSAIGKLMIGKTLATNGEEITNAMIGNDVLANYR